MSRKSFSVPRRPSRASMKPSRKTAAQAERQKMIVQLSGVSMKRAIVPPKLQKSAERKTSRMPMRSSRGETCGARPEVAVASVMASVSAIFRQDVARPATRQFGNR